MLSRLEREGRFDENEARKGWLCWVGAGLKIHHMATISMRERHDQRNPKKMMWGLLFCYILVSRHCLSSGTFYCSFYAVNALLRSIGGFHRFSESWRPCVSLAMCFFMRCHEHQSASSNSEWATLTEPIDLFHGKNGIAARS